MAINTAVRDALIDAVKAVPCRPINMNFPNEVAAVQSKDFPYMDVFFLADSIDERLIDGYIKTQLVQVDLYIDKGIDLVQMDKYKDSFQSHFAEGVNFGAFEVTSPPEVLSQGEDDTSFAVQLSFTIEYFDGE